MAKARGVTIPPDAVIKDYPGGPKVIAAKSRFWTAEAERRFLAKLSETCNVRAAAKAAGFGPDTAYRRRQRLPGFAARWREALTLGYQRLEEALLETAITSLATVPPAPETPLPRMTVTEALHLLRLHQEEVKRGGKGPGARRRDPGLDEVRAGIVRKLEAIERARERA